MQTLSTWYEFDYMTEMTVGWYSTIYYQVTTQHLHNQVESVAMMQMIVFLVGFIVSQLFIAVVCFGFENLEEQLSEPIFSDAVIGLPYGNLCFTVAHCGSTVAHCALLCFTVAHCALLWLYCGSLCFAVELETDPDDNLCKCINKPINPLLGSKSVELDRGSRDGIRVKVNFMYHYCAPAPLDAKGHYEPQDEEVEATVNPCFHNSSTSNIAGVGVPTMSSPVAVSASIDVASIPKGRTVVRSDGLPFVINTQKGSFAAVASGNCILSGVKEEEEPTPTTPIKVKPRTQKQLYSDYRELMQKWQDEEEQRVYEEDNAPFEIAQGNAKPRELEFVYDTLTTWSNERVFSLHTMLRAQEQIDPTNVIKFYHDIGGQIGQEMENELLADLVEVENETDMPELVVHVRAFIKTTVEPLAYPNCDIPQFALVGNETIGDIKRMSYDHLQGQTDEEGNDLLDSFVELHHCQIYVG